MSASTLERIRELHSDIQNIQSNIVEKMSLTASKSSSDRIYIDNYLKQQFELLHSSEESLLSLYNDEKSLKNEIDTMTGQNQMFQTFYEQLTQIKLYHTKYSN